MRNFDHVMDRVEREIEEVMGEKKWTPEHAKALEQLLNCEKCVKEIEKYAHAKKRMMGLPAPTEEEDEEMMEQPWNFDMYARGGRGRGRGRGNYERAENYERNNYARNNYGDDNYERRGGSNNYNYPGYMPPYQYCYPYEEEEIMDPMVEPIAVAHRKTAPMPMYARNGYTLGMDPAAVDPMMRRKAIPAPMYGGNQYTYGWDPMMEEKERLYAQKMLRRKNKFEDDDEEEEKKKEKELYEQNANSVGTPSTASQTNGAAKTR